MVTKITMVSHKSLLLFRNNCIFLLRPSNDPLKSIRYLILADFFKITAGSKNGSLVHQVLKISSSETRGSSSNLLKVYIFR